jgi:pimeloyl-ACP methyl ester carboxylesterase
LNSPVSGKLAQKIYLFSGLGADRRVFEKLSLPGNLVHIDWLIPQKYESLQQYSRRLIDANQIENNQILLGVSFGGILATEIAQLITAKQVILSSSVQHSRELPLIFRLAGHLHLYKFLPYSLLKKPNSLLRFAFSPLSDEDYQLLRKIVADTDITFLEWTIKQILLWQSNTPATNLLHVHGTSDKIFPFRHTPAIMAIRNGGHFMIYNRAAEVSEIIRKILR